MYFARLCPDIDPTLTFTIHEDGNRLKAEITYSSLVSNLSI